MFSKSYEKCEQNNGNEPTVHKNSNLPKSWKNTILKNRYSTLDRLCNDTTPNSVQRIYLSVNNDWIKQTHSSK